MATYSSILAWGIPWTEEPGGLQSTGHRHTHSLSDTESDMTEQLNTYTEPSLVAGTC